MDATHAPHRIERPCTQRLRVWLKEYGLDPEVLHHNSSISELYESALRHEKGTLISSTGALAAYSGAKTGRSPSDKRVVCEASTERDVWWGPVNFKMTPESFVICRERALNYLSTKERLYVFDGYAGADPRHQIKVRVISSRAYHALFMRNMLLRPTSDELEAYGDPDFVIFNSGEFPANRYTRDLTSSTSVSINFADRQMVILGTQYAGEMKKGIFTIMHYLMPKAGVLSLHSSANEGPEGDVTLFFGLSGTGKTTLSADPQRLLIGDDEHCWTDEGVFNIEGGCYAKAIGLNEVTEPEIFRAARFGAVLENVVIDPATREVDYSDGSITENTRLCYPIDFIPRAKQLSVGGHPKNIVLLTCDAFGVLPPVSKLTPAQTMYHFISGYTAKVAGTEMGVKEPEATFSACFGAPFLVWHPTVYASMLAERLRQHNAQAWLVNTGWSGGAHGRGGERMKLAYSRAIIDAIHSGVLEKAEYGTFPVFGLRIPTSCPGVPDHMLDPRRSWTDGAAFEAALDNLARLFVKNFGQFRDLASEEVLGAGPQVA